jgi:DNA-binding transcriptional LysR family regulator
MPRGRVRVNTSVPFGLHWLLPLLPGFFRLHPASASTSRSPIPLSI